MAGRSGRDGGLSQLPAETFAPPPARYLHLPSGSHLPVNEDAAPFIAVVVVEQPVEAGWQDHVSEWLVASRCHYMCAWGLDASSWDDSVDWASRRLNGADELPDDKWVMTTWHDHESLDQVFRYAGHCAQHPTIDLERVLIVHVAGGSAEDAMLTRYAEAQHGAQDH
ncbi:MAG: hypothetical protein K2X07_07620 [Caulobacteraceae bacterium]|nr:hypothetical protein [Caulobacteraceae bacterium]